MSFGGSYTCTLISSTHLISNRELNGKLRNSAYIWTIKASLAREDGVINLMTGMIYQSKIPDKAVSTYFNILTCSKKNNTHAKTAYMPTKHFSL